ncbi:MAG: mechanosensitive ion channel [Tannerellaceae bacterium]|nr:mechanosensitive ion channel [Tannerellaceae bacterium]
MLLVLLNVFLNPEQSLQGLINKATVLGWVIIKAIILFIVGRFLILQINRLVRRFLDRRAIDPSVKTFTRSLVNVILTVMLIISIADVLGIQTASFAALIASAGVTIGVALSGNLSNFAGGIIILLFRPFRVGNYIAAQSFEGTVKEIQIFHTIITTPDNRIIYVPNGSLSSGVVTNYNVTSTRRVEWIFGVEYGTDYETVKAALLELVKEEPRILPEPGPSVALKKLDASSVNIRLRAWVKNADYTSVEVDMNRKVYEAFNKLNINFPFPQLTIHQG